MVHNKGAGQRSSWLSNQDSHFCDQFLHNSKILSFSHDEPIIRFGEKRTNLYFLIEGTVQVFVPQENPKKVLSHVISPFEWFGAYGAFTGEHNIMKYRAYQTISALVVMHTDILALDKELTLYKAAGSLLGNYFKRYLELSAGFSRFSAEERVRAKLFSLTHFRLSERENGQKITISQTELAKMANTSRTIVSAVLSQLAEEEAIIVGYRYLIILKRERILKVSTN